MTYLNGQSLFSSATAGLSSTYSTLLSLSGSNGKLSLSSLTDPSDEVVSLLGSNNSFMSYLTSNFSSIDSDGDGNISSKDITKLTTAMQQKGLTYNEISQLCASGGSSTLTDTVLTYFNQIDKDKDGRVTSAEISAFGIESDKHQMENKYKSFRSSSMSTFYGSESADDDTSSVLDSLYPTNSSST